MKKSLLLVTLAAAVAALSGCSDSEGSSNGGGNESGATKIYWVASDYTTGELRAAVDTAETALALEVYQDSKVVSFDGAVFVLERMGADNVVRIDPETDEVLYQESLGAGANPYALVKADKGVGLATLFGADKVVFLDLATGKAKKSVDVSRFAADSGFANPSAALAVGDRIYVTLERLVAGVTPDANGMLLVFDGKKQTLVDSVELHCVDPIALAESKGRLLVACKGSSTWDANWNETSNNDGSLVAVDLADMAVVELADETARNAKPSQLVSDGSNVWVGLYRSYGDEVVAKATIGDSKATFETVAGVVNAFGGIDAEGDLLVVGDQDYAGSGVRTFKKGKAGAVFGDADGDPAPISVAILK